MSINVNDKNLGHATAYAYYKAGGGTMTEAEFTEFMADFGTASQTAVEAAQAALASETAARNASTTATNKASEATTAAQTATSKAAEASTSASTATSAKDTAVSASQTATSKASEATTAAATATSAKTDAVAANTAAQSAKTAAQTAQTGAETAAASVSASAEQIATNAEDISQLKSDLTQLVPKIEKVVTLGKEDAGWNLLKKTDDSQKKDDADGTRIRIIFFIPFNSIHVTAQCSYGSGLSISIYDTFDQAIRATSTYQQTLSYSYTTETLDGVFENGGYISISQKKTDGTTFTAEERAAAFEALNLSITYNTGESYIEDNANNIEGFAKGVERLYVGELINGHLIATGVVDDSYTNLRLSTPTVVALPCGSKRKIKVHINPPYNFAMRVGARADNLNQNLYWYEEGDIITIPDGYNYYAISIARSVQSGQFEGWTITPKERVNIGLSLEYLCNDGDVNERNAEPSKFLSNAMLASLTGYKTQSKYALIGHTSDPHADYKRVDNFLSFCNQNKVDVACVTGDIVGYDPKQGIDWFHELINKYDVLSAFCAGNHDVYSSTMDDDDIYDFMFDNVAEKIGNATGKTWYYTDISAKKLRVISVNLYQYGGKSRWYTHFTDDQLSWLVSTMASTPNDYGIIILAHAPQVSLDTAKDSDYGAFYQNERLYNNTHNSVSGGVPIYDIVDAFISRTTLSKTYTQTGSPSSVSVTADFTGVDSSVEFIAHLTGHFHQDTICYVPSRANKQLMLNVTCTNAIYGGSTYPYLADIQDQGRSNMDVTQDAFNVYVIDRDNKTVKVVRIGNNITYNMTDRKYMEIPYAD